jgi:hypothetical protein
MFGDRYMYDVRFYPSTTTIKREKKRKAINYILNMQKKHQKYTKF